LNDVLLTDDDSRARPFEAISAVDHRAESPHGNCTPNATSLTSAHVQELSLKDPDAGHVDPISGNYISHDPAGSAIIQSRIASSSSSVMPSQAMVGSAIPNAELNTDTMYNPSTISSNGSTEDEVRSFIEFFEEDSVAHPYEHAFFLITELVNTLIEAKSTVEPASYAWWDILHKTMVSKDLLHSEKVLAFRNRLCTRLGEPYEIVYASKRKEYSTRHRTPTNCSLPTHALVKSPLAEDEWVMLYDEEMCDHSLYPPENSKQALYPKPLPDDFLRIMEATANATLQTNIDDTLLKAVEELQFEQFDVQVLENSGHGPLNVRNPDEIVEKEEDSTRNPKEKDTACEGKRGMSFVPTSCPTSQLQSTQCLDSSTQSPLLEQSPLMITRLKALDRRAWTEVTPRLKGLQGQEIAPQKEWTRQLRVVQKTLFAEKDDILARWAGHSPPSALLYYENIEPASGQPLPATEKREKLGVLDYMNWTLTTPKFAGKDGAPLGPEAEWDELSRLIRLKLGESSKAERDIESIQASGLTSTMTQPYSTQGNPEYVRTVSLLSSQDDINLRIIQLRMEKLEAMRDHDFIDWMRTFGSQNEPEKISPLNVTTSEYVDEDGNYMSPLHGRKLVMQQAFGTPDYEIEYGTMYRAESLDASHPHPEDPGDGYLPLTFGSPWDLEESKAEAYQRLRCMGKSGWSGPERLILIVLISHAKYIKKRGPINERRANVIAQANDKSEGTPNWLFWLTDCAHADFSLEACEDIQTLAEFFKHQAHHTDPTKYSEREAHQEAQAIVNVCNVAISSIFWDQARQLYENNYDTFYLTLAKFKMTKPEKGDDECGTFGGAQLEELIGEIPQLFYPQHESFGVE
jgi:hypothetical protein